MSWEKKRVLVTVKTYPERSRKYISSVCTVGLTEEGEWIRLYPIPLSVFTGPDKIRKYDWIEVECAKADEKLGRKESYKVRPGSLRMVDRSLNEKKANGKVDWAGRNRLILGHVSRSLEALVDNYKEDRTSVGIIKPSEVLEFYKIGDLRIYQDKKEFQRDILGSPMPVVERIPHIFGYRFRCAGCGMDHVHEIQCEDWELLEAYRKGGLLYEDTSTLWKKLQEKFYTWMLQQDLYFYMGMYSRYPTWLIIGLYYPPNG